MRNVGAFEAKTHLAALLNELAADEQITTMTRHGRPVARLVQSGDKVRPDVASTIVRLRGLSAGQTLGDFSWRKLRDQGQQ